MNMINKKNGIKKSLLTFCGTLCVVIACAQASGGQITRKKSNKPVQNTHKSVTKKQFVVTNAKEFLDAIGSNREIIVKTSTSIDLTDEMIKRLNDGSVLEHKLEKNVAKGLYADWGMSGPGVVFAGLNNLSIKGYTKKTEIRVESYECAVIRLIKCSNIKFENLVLGHNRGTCYGPVIQIDTCKNISVLSSGLFGCGTEGLCINSSTGIVCKESQIYSCRDHIVTIYGNSRNIHFSDCNIYDIGKQSLSVFGPGGFVIGKEANKIVFTRCNMRDIRGVLFNKVESMLLLENCQISHNKDKSGDMSNVVLKNCQWIVPANARQESIGKRQHSVDSISNTKKKQHIMDSVITVDYANFDDVFSFSEGYAAVEINKKWGFIDKSGNMVIPCKYDFKPMVFSEGLVSVSLNEREGFIDKTGRVVIPFSYDCTYDFKDGLAQVIINDKYGFIDKTGKMVVPCKYDFASDSFYGGLARVEIKEKFGFINRTGRKVISLKYDSALDFKDGLARVELKGKLGFIDNTGRVVIPFIYDDVGEFSEGLAGVIHNGKRGFVDKTGNVEVPYKYDYDEDEYGVGDYEANFSEGLAKVKLNEKYGYINIYGREIVPCKYSSAKAFREGLAAVCLDGKWGFIDKTGRQVVPCNYSSADSFYKGFAIVVRNGKYGFVDNTGREVIPCKFENAKKFHEGFAGVKINGKWGFVDTAGIPLKLKK